jgi:transcriptional regulator GlxA family with amidase domain
VCIFYPQPFTHRLIVPTGSQAELICATLEFREAWHNPFLLALPPWMVIPVDLVKGIGDVVEMLSRETVNGGLGQAFVIDKLCDILVCQLIRHAQETGMLKAGVLAGFSDPGIAQALAAVHKDPAHNWRVDSMAAIACMSRSAFAKRFHELVGISPASYVTGWRLSLAESLLLQQQSVKAVAREVGYGTQQSFARAFIEKHGVSPTTWLAVQAQVRRRS